MSLQLDWSVLLEILIVNCHLKSCVRFLNLAYRVSIDKIGKALITASQSREFVHVLTLNSLQPLFPLVLRRHSSANAAGKSGKHLKGGTTF